MTSKRNGGACLTSCTVARTQLALSERRDKHGFVAQWIGPLIALGTRAARYYRKAVDRQLVIVLSVPKRDFAAALIGCGWVLASEAPALASPLETLRRMQPGQPMRAVNSSQIISGTFSSLDEDTVPPRAQFAGVWWQVDKIRALAALKELNTEARELRPEPGSLEHMARLHLDWDTRLAYPAADLAIVGTLNWLEQDFDAYLSKEADGLPPSYIESLLKPMNAKAATWYTRLFASARLADHLPLADDLNAVILDGNGAIKYLGDIEAPVVICVLDRSVADETSAELAMQLRNTRGEPLPLWESLGWTPPTSVEALAFTMAL